MGKDVGKSGFFGGGGSGWGSEYESEDVKPFVCVCRRT